MLPLVTYGITEASTTRRPVDAVDAHRRGSTTDGVAGAHPARARRVQGGLGVAPTQSRISSSVATSGPGETSPASNGANAGWRGCPGGADRLDPLAAVVRRRQVVEAQRRLDHGVGRGDPHRAAHVGVHRPDVDLVAVATLAAAPSRRSARRSAGSGTSGSGRRRRRCCARTRRPRSGWSCRAPPDDPLQPDPRPPVPRQQRVERHRLARRVLDVHLEVVLQVARRRPAGGG